VRRHFTPNQAFLGGGNRTVAVPNLSLTLGAAAPSISQSGGVTGSDFSARASAPAVVWAHNFVGVAEVNNFREDSDSHLDPANTGPNTVSYLNPATAGIDGIGGAVRTAAPQGFPGCPAGAWYELQDSASGWVHFPAGTTYAAIDSMHGTYTFPDSSTITYTRNNIGDPAPRNTAAWNPGLVNGVQWPVNQGGWNRPFFPIAGTSNGIGTDDPAAGGTLTLRTWNLGNVTQINDAREGYGFYGHSDYFTITNSSFGPNQWDGSEFWMQFRVRISNGRFTKRADPTGGNSAGLMINSPQGGQNNIAAGFEYPPGGKLCFVEKLGGGAQELILISGGGAQQQYFYQTYPARVYTGFGAHDLDDFVAPDASGHVSIEPGSPYAAICYIGGTLNSAGLCWEWPTAEWVTVLMHVIPGHQNTADTTVEYWMARAAEATYTRLFTCTTCNINFDLFGQPGIKPGWQNFAGNCYFNNQPSFVGITQDYAQVIFSRQYIDVPAPIGSSVPAWL